MSRPLRAALAAALLLLAACAPTAATPVQAPQRPSALTAERPAPDLRAIQTVFLIVMENHNWDQIKGSPAAPYINRELLPIASSADRYFNPPGVHPSEPNYLWLEAGTSFGIHDDRDPAVNHQATGDHLVSLLDRAGISWRSYQEGVSGEDCPLVAAGAYAPKHNPMIFFDDVTGGGDPRSASCISHVRPYHELARDLAQGSVARYNFITPNLCNDMHDAHACPDGDPIAIGDAWLASAVPMIMGSEAYRSGGAIFITWDEGRGGDGPIGMIVISPLARGGGYVSHLPYTHSSTLRTIQEIFGVAPLLGDAARASSLADLFAPAR